MSEGAAAMLSAGPAESSGQVVGGEQSVETVAPAAAAPTAGNDNWYSKITDADLRGYIENKGWKDPADVAVGYKNLEKLVGGDKVAIPKTAEDKAGWDMVYNALGRPKSADDYALAVPEGSDPSFAKAAGDKFHELGISKSQAQALGEWWNTTQGGKMAEMQQQVSQKSQADLEAIRAEWGGAYAENIELSRRAAREFGLDHPKLVALENAMGTGETLKFMARVGRGLLEHNFEGGQTTTSFGMTPEAAKGRVTALQQDREWSAKYISGNADAKAEMRRLMEIAYPEG